MSNLERFEDDGFEIVSKGRKVNVQVDVLLTLPGADAKDKKVAIGILDTTLRISKYDYRKGDGSIKLVPIIQPSTKRLYLVEDETGYSFAKAADRGDRLWMASKPLYDKFVKQYNFRKVVDGKLKWDEDLQAYYVEVN